MQSFEEEKNYIGSQVVDSTDLSETERIKIILKTSPMYKFMRI